jgi:tRNA U38,U39,U40 pseudouridine synthase TruA
VKKEPKFYLTTREEFFAKNSNKILDKKGFVFSTHKTDKERINEFLKNKAALEKYHNEINAKKPKQINVPSFIQPSMRFKARTDFERVLEQLHGNKESFNREKNKIKKQLQKINGDLSDFSDNSDYEEYLPKKKKKMIKTII